MTKKHNLQNINFSKIVDQNINHDFYKKISEKIIQYIENNKSASFSELIAYVGGGERRVVRLLDQMVNLGILKYTNYKFTLPYNKNPGIKISDIRCNLCDSKVVNIEGKMKPLLNFMVKVLQQRPESTFIFDQRPVNLKTTVRRVAYAIWRGDIQNKRVAVIGDDDLTSIALARAYMAEEIVVFDIDDRILSLINKISKLHKLNIKTVKQDLLNKVPSIYSNHFDTFITDPTPTVKPLSLFTIRGLQMLIKKQGKVGYISLYPSHMDMNVDFQKILSKMNILITDLIPFFNQYEIINHTLSKNDKILIKKYGGSRKTISFYEYLMRIETTALTKPLKLKFSPIDLLGKATKQVLKKPIKDPVLRHNNKPSFITNYALNVKKIIERKH